MSNAPRQVLILAGGISHERDVSLRSGRRVADSLQSHGIQVTLRDPDASLLPFLREHKPDVVWPALHGASGEDGALTGLLDFLGIPFVGSRADAARLAWNKPVAKAIVARAGVPTPRSITLPKVSLPISARRPYRCAQSIIEAPPPLPCHPEPRSLTHGG